MFKFLSDFWDFIFPPYCAVCGEPLNGEKMICNECLGKVYFISNKRCRICGKAIKSGNICSNCKDNLPDFDFAIGCGNYVSPLSDIIKFYKYRYRPSFSHRLARLLYASYLTRGDIIGLNNLVTWVPMRRVELRERGYNQSRLLADKFASIAGLKSVPLLRKIKNIPSQTKLAPDERLTNVRGVYSVDYKELNRGNRNFYDTVIIVDDVLTTGATMQECASALKKAGVPRVIGLILAISP
ncbi:ComF family protein [candidate division WOR-3 bacterium]|nr:ComF family protein [candidate division WOR-3 bacterium]